VEAYFKSHKPLSFTTRIEFSDDSGRVYVVPISGTTDNSLLTNFAYLQRRQNEFQIAYEDDKKPLILTEVEQSDDDENSENERISKTSKTGSFSQNTKKKGNKSIYSYASSKSARSALGYSPIPLNQLERSCNYITRWLNFNVLTQPVSSFPWGVIDNCGNEVFELITYLTGRNMATIKANIEKVTKRIEKTKLLWK
jgi:hypothetical protein